MYGRASGLARALRLAVLAASLVALFALAPIGRARADVPPPMSARTISLPSGPGAMKGLGESFSPNLSTGAGNFSVPLELPPGLGKPSISLNYTHGRGRTEIGASFNLPKLNIYRTRDKGSPAFLESDRFAVAGADFTDELVQVNEDKRYYRLRNEGAFALFVRDVANDAWTIHYPNGDTARLGVDASSRQYAVRGTAKWFVKTLTNPEGHQTEYDYFTDAGYVYLLSIRYRLHAPGYEDHVDFVYESRGDPFTDYGYGSATTCRQRLARVEAWAGAGAGSSRKLRTYLLTYIQTTQSFLESVTEQGEGGTPDVTIPTLHFTYERPSQGLGATVTMRQSLPLDLYEGGRAQLDDVNGDGLLDLLVGVAGNYTYYENLTGVSWSDANAVARSPDVSLDDASNGVVLADVNGDGFRDVLRSSSSGYSYFPGGNVAGGRLVAYLPKVAVGAPIGAPLWNTAGARLADLNLDGRTDVLRADGTHSLKDLNLRDASGERVQETLDGELPLDAARLFSDPSLQMLDFNGDAVQDFVLNEISQGDSRLRVSYGLGGGRFAPFVAVQAPKGNASEFLFGDINNDGYVDLVRYSGQQITYWLGAGDEQLLGPYGPFTPWSAPTRSSVRSVQLVDMDGSGTADLALFTKTNKIVYVRFFTSPFLGLLSQIDNGMGLVTTLKYRTSTDYAVDAKLRGAPWRTTLPRSIPVVSEMTVSDSVDKLGLPASVTHTTYDYADGYWDGKEREFRGFGYVKVTADGDDHAEAKVTETWMHLGIDPATGADQEVLKGKVLREVVTSGDDGKIYSSVETSWEPHWLCSEDAAEVRDVLPVCASYLQKQDSKDHLVAHARSTAMLHGIWEKTLAPKYVLETMAYDVWEHVTRHAEYGEVLFRAPHAFGAPFSIADVTDVGNDERVEVTQNAYDVGRWILALPVRTEHRDPHSDVLLGATENYYDGAAFVGLPFGQVERGRVSRTRTWLAEKNRWIDQVRYAYDSLGLVVETLDALGNHGSLAYDAETRTLPTREVVDVAGGQIVFQASYDTAAGTTLTSTEPNGNVTHYAFDGLGRLKTVFDAQSTDGQPTLTYDYTYGSPDNPISTVREQHLLDRATGTYRSTWHYSDAMGRTRLAKVAGDAPGTYVASGWADFSPSGAEILHYEEYPSTGLGLEAPPVGTRYTESFYDGLGRVTRLSPPSDGPGRTYTWTRRFPFETQVFDEEDTGEATAPEAKWKYPAITRVDGLGHVRQIVKYNDYRASDGTSRAQKELTWTFEYNPFGNLTAWTDPNHALDPTRAGVRNYAFDSLGRMTELFDPNLGAIHYEYDDGNNLTRRADALGQERRYEYGPGNRLLRVAVANDAHQRPDYQYVYHYDAAAPDGPIPQAANLAGRLAWVEWPAGSTHFSFDTLGRTVSEVQSIWNPEKSAFESQKRDVLARQRDYDASGEVLRTRLPGGRTFAATYTTRGFVRSVSTARGDQAARALVSNVGYDLEGKVVRTDNANGTVGCAWYTARGEVRAVASGVPSGAGAGAGAGLSCDADPTQKIPGTFQHLLYERTAARTISKVTDLSADGSLPALDAEYSYDRLHELTVARTAKGTDSYEYDAIQNLVSHASSVAGAQSIVGEMAYGEGGAGPNQVTTAGGTPLAYDGVGNLKSYNGYTLEWNAENKLVTAHKEGGSTIRYYYDFLGERRITTVERPGASLEVYREIFDEYQIRNGEEVWTTGAGHTGVEISLKPGEAEATRFAHKDNLTGTTHLTDESGTIVGFDQYGPYGDVRGHIGSRPMLHGFAGALSEPDEELGLVRFGARYYAPALAHWVSADVFLGESPSHLLDRPLEAGLYNYVSNNPTNLIDPLGTDSRMERAWGWTKAFGVGFGKGVVGAAKETVQGVAQMVTHPVDTAKAAYEGAREVVRDPVGAATRAVEGVKQSAIEVYETVKSGDPDKIGQLAGKAAFNAALSYAGGKLLSAGGSLAKAGVQRLAGAVERAAPKLAARAAETLKRITPRHCPGDSCHLPGGNCFVAGTLVLASQGGVPIESVRIGQRVLTPGAPDVRGAEVDRSWRVVQLEMPNPDGSEDWIEIELLRPPTWLAVNGIATGAWVAIDLDDVELRGVARVVGVLPAPLVEAGDGRIVTGTFAHRNGFVVRLHLAGADDIETTETHRFFSIDRGGWARASDLQPGERLAAKAGEIRLVGEERVSDVHRVYNLEVDAEHEYFVGREGVRAHNACPKGGTYKLIDEETGAVRRTGRTNDLVRREGEHARMPETKDLKFEVDRRTDSYAAQRGREQRIWEQHPEADLNRKKPIADTNPRRGKYLRAGDRLK